MSKQIDIEKMGLTESFTVAIVGNKGSGKTVLLEKLATDFFESGRDVIYIDVIGATFEHAKNHEVDDSYFNWVNVDIAKVEEDVLKKYIAKVIKVDHINAFNLMMLTQREKVEFANRLFKILQKIKDYVLIIDEIQELTPQLRGSYAEEVERIIRIGRNFGIKPIIFSSQRPQVVSKQVLALSDIFIIKKIDYYRDADIIAEIIGLGKEGRKKLRRQLKNLKVNESYLVQGNYAEKIIYDIEKQKFFLPIAGRKVEWFEEGD